MNMLKCFLLYSLFFTTHNFYSQQPPTDNINQPLEVAISSINNNQSESTTITAPTLPTIIEKIETTTPSKEEVVTEKKLEEKTELTDWQNHLQALLTKNAFWDAANNTIEDGWQDKAFELAELILKKDISLAAELKTSFFSSAEKKFTNIEEKPNLVSFYAIIERFNEGVKSLTSKLSAKEEKPKVDVQADEDGNHSPNVHVQEGSISVPEEKIEQQETNSTEQELSELEATEQKKEKRQSEWLECLENIKTAGQDEVEFKAIIQEATRIAKKLILLFSSTEEQKNKADILKSEFKAAINARAKELYSMNKTVAITLFNSEIDTIFANQTAEYQEPFIGAQIPMEDDFFMTKNDFSNAKENNSRTSNTQRMPTEVESAEQKEATKPIQQQPTNQASEKTAPVSTTIQVQTNYVDQSAARIQADIAEKAKIEAQEKKEENKKKQLLLAQKIHLSAVQKAAEEKAEAEKGIITSIKERIFGSSSTSKKRLEELYKEQSDLIEQMIQNKPELTDQSTKDLIRSTYRIFQESLLSFDIKKFWDNNDKPTELLTKWVYKINASLKILLKYDVMNVDTVKNILKDTVRANDTITIKRSKKLYNYLINLIIPSLQYYITVEIAEEKAEIQKRQETEIQRKYLEKANREYEEQSRIQREEKQRKEAAIQQEKEKIAAINRFNKLENEWKNLLDAIKSHKIEQQDLQEYTAQAIKITHEMLALHPNDKRSVIEKHRTEFSQTLIEQYRINEQKYVYDCMDNFIKTIHQ